MKRLDLLYRVLRQSHGVGPVANRRNWALQFLAACFAPIAAAQPGSRSQSGASSLPSFGPAPGSAGRPDPRAPTAQASASGANALADWQRRSRAPGVLFAHAFESEAELTGFVRKPGAANPLRIVQTDIGPALRGMTMGTTIVADVPACGQGELQWWQVANTAHLPQSAPPYRLYVGKRKLGCVEEVEVQQVDKLRNRVLLKRRVADDGIKIDGQVYKSGTAPPYRGDGSWRIGIDSTGLWVRPLAALRAAGLPPDIGITNGAARKARVWPDERPHLNFREGYWGHRSYWDPQHGAAEYRNWLPRDNAGRRGGVRAEAFEGDELWIQFRARISRDRLEPDQPRTKMLFIQTCTGSGSGQFFWTAGPNKDDTSSEDEEGSMLIGRTSYADRAAPAGGVLSVPQGHGLGKSVPPKAWQDPRSFPECRWQGHSKKKAPECWRFPADEWVTYLLHFKFGRDNAPVNEKGKSTSKLRGPWPAETDPAYRTTFQLYVARQGQAEYTTITDYDAFTWFFGDQKFQAGYYFYNPPGLNALWLGAPGNQYLGSGSVAPPPRPNWIDYTQVIVSRQRIALPA
jgi:hypothetical protein